MSVLIIDPEIHRIFHDEIGWKVAQLSGALSESAEEEKILKIKISDGSKLEVKISDGMILVSYNND
ncbi:hypothetical protein M1105_18525 [Limibaculum sp. FT325]|uniref:hypothetical protein n=1 Tax=Thermohalobaculum sediminis TaxID=2939436 RepID=UPI0020BE4C2A|nr:hypothetical protein [Limibaculum sediminis]MCL5778969.1 hypothetical protein [Limibaculum sediminis]